MKKYIAILLLIFSGSVISATESYKCQYSHFSRSTGFKESSGTDIHIFTFDKVTQKASLNDGSSTYEFYLVYTSDLVRAALIQVTPIGNVNSLTISHDLKVVYSRNTMLGDSLSASQFYGTCVEL